jgi:hypothetical protein
MTQTTRHLLPDLDPDLDKPMLQRLIQDHRTMGRAQTRYALNIPPDTRRHVPSIQNSNSCCYRVVRHVELRQPLMSIQTQLIWRQCRLLLRQHRILLLLTLTANSHTIQPSSRRAERRPSLDILMMLPERLVPLKAAPLLLPDSHPFQVGYTHLRFCHQPTKVGVRLLQVLHERVRRPPAVGERA